MSPLVQQAIGSILRHFLTMAASILVTRGIWTEQDALSYVGAAAMALIGMGWSFWQKYTAEGKIDEALAMPEFSSRKDMEK